MGKELARELIRIGRSLCLWVAVVGLLAPWFSKAERPAFATSPSVISCPSAYQIGAWSWEKSPSDKPKSLADRDFGQKVGQRFIELSDPHRVLFLESERKQFLDQIPGAWHQFAQKQKCDAFQQWLGGAYLVGKARFERLLKIAETGSFFPKKLPLQSKEEKYPQYTSYAKDEKELAKRVERFGRAVAESSDAYQLAAFKGDKRELVKHALDRIVFSETQPNAVHLLAKAFVSAVDPYSDYFTEQEYDEFYRDLVGGISGVGVQVREIPDGLLVQKVIADSPAGRSGAIRAGDRITQVDETRLQGLPSSRLRHILEGPEHTPVELTVVSGLNSSSSRKVRLVRRSFAFEDARVSLKFVTLKTGDKSAVITVPSFYGRGGEGLSGERSSAEDVERALARALKKNPSVVVIDLRGNPGGYLEEAVAMAGLFLGDLPVVAVVEPTSKRVLRDFQAKAKYRGPLMVLVDEESASAAEVLAGALKDYQRALVLGTPSTYGKGSVQRLFHLDSGLVKLPQEDQKGVLKLTTSFFYSPLGKSPAEGGMQPHIALKSEKSEEAKRPTPRQRVPHQNPFVDAPTLSQIRIQEKLMADRIAVLKQSSAVRTADVKAVFETAVKKAFQASSDVEQASLVDTLAIADDFVRLDTR